MKLFLSVGAMKAGTTWLYSQLDKHNELYFTPEKEVHFLDHHYNKSNVLLDENRLRNAKNKLAHFSGDHLGVYKMLSRWYAMYLEHPDTFKWYERIFSLNRTAKYNCDFSNLTCHMSASHWFDLNSLVDELKVLYIIRDPLKRYWSHIKFHHEFIGDTHDFSNWRTSDFSDFLNKPFMSSNGRYAEKIKTLTSVFDDQTFKMIFFEDMVGSPTDSLYDIEDFLNVAHINYDHGQLKKATNTSRKIPMPITFIEACKPIVERDLEDLQQIGLSIPDNWTKI